MLQTVHLVLFIVINLLLVTYLFALQFTRFFSNYNHYYNILLNLNFVIIVLYFVSLYIAYIFVCVAHAYYHIPEIVDVLVNNGKITLSVVDSKGNVLSEQVYPSYAALIEETKHTDSTQFDSKEFNKSSKPIVSSPKEIKKTIPGAVVGIAIDQASAAVVEPIREAGLSEMGKAVAKDLENSPFNSVKGMVVAFSGNADPNNVHDWQGPYTPAQLGVRPSLDPTSMLRILVNPEDHTITCCADIKKATVLLNDNMLSRDLAEGKDNVITTIERKFTTFGVDYLTKNREVCIQKIDAEYLKKILYTAPGSPSPHDLHNSFN